MRRCAEIVRETLLKIGFLLGRINTFLLLTLSFYLILLPLALLWRLFSRRPDSSGWLPRAQLPSDHFKRQY